MTVTIEITCPHCHGKSIKKNGKKSNGKQNYLCKECRRQFIREEELDVEGRKPWIVSLIVLMVVEGCGIRNINRILHVSLAKILDIVKHMKYKIKPKQEHYDILEIDEFWTYVQNKKNKKWLIYAYHRATGEVVAYVWGSRNKETAKKLRKKIRRMGVTYDKIATDDWDSFVAVFGQDQHLVGKQYTKGIEGNNCWFRHHNRRVFRKTCCFSKSFSNHRKVFDANFVYRNNGMSFDS
jgi:IS1 family transposase/transposase-like protein